MSEPGRSQGGGTALVTVGLLMLLTMVVVTVLGTWIAPYNPSETSPDSLAGPSVAHWLGTDSIGRDVLSRLIIGGRTTLLITFIAVAISVGVGLVLGLSSGYVGGVVDQVIMRVLDVGLVETSLMLAQTIFTVTALSFLGLGPPPPDPNWGGMLSEGRQFMELAPLTVVGPAMAIVFATLTFIVLANGLREWLDVGSR